MLLVGCFSSFFVPTTTTTITTIIIIVIRSSQTCSSRSRRSTATLVEVDQRGRLLEHLLTYLFTGRWASVEGSRPRRSLPSPRSSRSSPPPDTPTWPLQRCRSRNKKCKRKGSLYSITERRFRSWSRFLAVSLQVTWVVTRAVCCHYRAYFPPGPQLPSRPLRGLLPFSLLGEHRHGGCEQFA